MLFAPKLKQVNLDAFTELEKKKLLDGKVIVTDIDDVERHEDGTEDSQRIRAFVQLDKDTNDVVYSPTQIIGRNISAICAEYDLTGEDLSHSGTAILSQSSPRRRMAVRSLSPLVLTCSQTRESLLFQVLPSSGKTP